MMKFNHQHMVFTSWTEYLLCGEFLWWTKRQEGLSKVWNSHGLEGADKSCQLTNCYFCTIDMTEINRKNQSSFKYLDLDSARCPEKKLNDLVHNLSLSKHPEAIGIQTEGKEPLFWQCRIIVYHKTSRSTSRHQMLLSFCHSATVPTQTLETVHWQDFFPPKSFFG